MTLCPFLHWTENRVRSPGRSASAVSDLPPPPKPPRRIKSLLVRKITLITTGGTIEKTYDEHTGELANRRSLVRRMLSELRLGGTQGKRFDVMRKAHRQ